jgi:CHAD domain-containing protein
MAKARAIEGLDCHAPALKGIRLVLLTRLDEMCALNRAAVDWSDTGGVHDMRVASRRLRSALHDFRPYLRRKVRQRRLREMARTLGDVRDEDVAIKALDKLHAEVSEEIANGIARIIDERNWRRERAREALEVAIGEGRILRLQGKLMHRFERATRMEESLDADANGNAPLSFRRAGEEIIHKRLEELYSLGESLYQPFAIRRLHEMRIAAKQLRYAMELFAPCWGESLTSFSTEVTRMQDSLGDLHDCDVWIEDLGRRLRRRDEATEESFVSRRALRIASIWLMQHYTKERDRHYRHALDIWHEWEERDFSSSLLSALAEDAGKGMDTQPAIVATS